MAGQVPTASEFRVAPEGGTPYADSPPVQQTAGRQLAQMGGALVSAGTDASAIFLDKARELNKTRVEEATLRAMAAADRLTVGEEEGYTHVRGGDAVNRERHMADDWGQRFDDNLASIESSLGNDAQRIEFRRVAGRMRQGFRGRIEEHVAKQSDVYQVSVATGKINTLTRELTLSGDRPERMGALIEGIEGATGDILRLQGRSDPDDIKSQTQIEVGKAMKTSMSYLLDNGDTDLAAAMFDQFSSRADADSRHDMSLALRQQKRTDTALDLADRATSLMAGTANSGDHDLGLPIAGMTSAMVTGKFGDTRSKPGGGTRTHKGVDIPIARGTAVLAAGDGVARLKAEGGGKKGWGYYVEIDHGDGTVTRYAHLDGHIPDLKDGQRVRRGQVIGKSGSSGRSTGPHLHYEVVKGGVQVNPLGDHRIKGARAGSEADAIAFIYDNAPDARTAEMAVGKFRERWAAHERDKERQREDDVGNAMLSLRNGKTVPASIMARLSPRDRVAIDEYSDALEKQRAAGAPDAKNAEWATNLQLIVGGQITDVRQLAARAPFMDPSDYRHLERMLKGDKGGQKGLYSAAFTTLGRVESTLRQLGVDEKSNPEEYARYKRAFLADVDRLAARRKEPPTDEEMYGRAMALAGKHASGGRVYQSTKPVIIKYNAIPAGMRNAIETRLRQRGYNPSSPNWQKMVEQTYYQM